MAHAYRFFPQPGSLSLEDIQLQGLRWTVRHAFHGSPFYRKRLQQAGVDPDSIKALDDIRSLPCTTADDLRAGYPFPLLSVPEEQVVRIHASSGTTGKRKILAYTARDLAEWKLMMARCYELAGLTTRDRVQIAVGYGLWTAGVGFQLGCEHFGAMALPLGPGNLEFQLQFLEDLQPTCACCTASMALLLAEQVDKNGLRDRLSLHTLIFGSEPHTPKMAKRIRTLLGIRETFDITGLTELYGPGAGQECRAHQGIHYWADKYILEILDPETLQPVPEGEVGEMVVTTLTKEAAPLIRYRTRDLTRLVPGPCPCGLPMPRHDRIFGRSDDMFIFRGVNIYPGQIADVLERHPEVGPEYRIHLQRRDGLDSMTIQVERRPESEPAAVDPAPALARDLHKHLMARAEVQILDPGRLPRTFSKTKRVLDERYEDAVD